MEIKNVIAVLISISLCFNVIGINAYADEIVNLDEQQNETNTDKQQNEQILQNINQLKENIEQKENISEIINIFNTNKFDVTASIADDMLVILDNNTTYVVDGKYECANIYTKQVLQCFLDIVYDKYDNVVKELDNNKLLELDICKQQLSKEEITIDDIKDLVKYLNEMFTKQIKFEVKETDIDERFEFRIKAIDYNSLKLSEEYSVKGNIEKIVNEMIYTLSVLQDIRYDESFDLTYLKAARDNVEDLYDEALESSKEQLEEISDEAKVYLTEIFESDEIKVTSNMKLVINKDGQQDKYIISFNINDIEFGLDVIASTGLDFFVRENYGLSTKLLNQMMHFLQAQYNAEVASGKDKMKVIDNMITSMICVSNFTDFFTEYGEGNTLRFDDFLLEEKFSIYQIFSRFNLSNNEYAVRYINKVYEDSDNMALLTMATAILLARNTEEHFVTIITDTDKRKLKKYIKDVLNVDSAIFEFNNTRNDNEITEDTDLVITDYDSYSSAIAYDIIQLFKYSSIDNLLDILNITDVDINKSDDEDESIIEIKFANSDDSFNLFDFMKNGKESVMCQFLDEEQKENIEEMRDEIFETFSLYIPYERLSDFVCNDATNIVEELEDPSKIDNNVITQTNSIVTFNSFTEGVAFTKDSSLADEEVLNDMGFYINESEYVDVEDIPQSEDIIVQIESEQAKIYAKSQENLNIERITQQEAEEKYSEEIVEKIQEQLGDTKLDYIKSKYDGNFVDEIEYLYNNDKQKVYNANSSYTKEQIDEIISEIQNPKISDQMWFALYNYDQAVVLANKFGVDGVKIISQEENDEEVPENTMVITSMDLIESNITAILTSLCKQNIKYKDKKIINDMIVVQTDLNQLGQQMIELKNSMNDIELNKIERLEQSRQEKSIKKLIGEIYPEQEESKLKKWFIHVWDVITYTIESYLPGTNFNKYKKIKSKIESKAKKFNKLQNKFLNIFEERDTANMLFDGIKYEDGCFYFNFVK